MPEYRRILLDGYPSHVERVGDSLIAGDGRSARAEDAVHLAPVTPTKIICIHLNYHSRVAEFMTKLPPAPTYFHKPVNALTGHKSHVVRPNGCEWLNYEGEIAIVIGKTCRNVSPADAADYIAGYSVASLDLRFASTLTAGYLSSLEVTIREGKQRPARGHGDRHLHQPQFLDARDENLHRPSQRHQP